MRGRISKEIVEKMKQDRLAGASYSQIEKTYGVSRWTSVKYLRGIELDKGFADDLWRKAEVKGGEYLEAKGFSHILNLNQISPQSFFDFYAEKGTEKWLVDVTINESKDVVAKSLKLVDGFRCAILYVDHGLEKFRFVELKEIK